MEIICDSCKKEFELDSKKNYMGDTLDKKHNDDTKDK